MRGRSFNFWMPGERVKTEIIERKFKISQKVYCKFDCANFNKDSLNIIIKSSVVNFKESWVKGKPCKVYILNEEKQKLKMEFVLCDTVVTLNDFNKAGVNCDCGGYVID
jgi:hypothetical protein